MNQSSLIADDEDEKPTANGKPPEQEHFGTATFADKPEGDTSAHTLAEQAAQTDASAKPRRQYRPRNHDQRQFATQAEQREGDPGNLTYDFESRNLPPLEGHEQVFVRYKIHGVEDWDNVRDYQARGFAPRLKSSVPPGYRVDIKSVRVDEDDFGQVVANKDRILMTRPLALGKAERASEANRSMAIEDQIRRGMQELDGFGVTSEIEQMQVGSYDKGQFHFPRGV